MSDLKKFQVAAGGFGNGVTSSFNPTVTSDVGNFVAGAQRNVSQLLNSGVNSQGQVVGPLGDMFGHDPATFAMNATKHFNSLFRSAVNRVADRAGRATYDVDVPHGKVSTVQVPARVTSRTTVPELTLTVTLAAIHHPAILLEEAGRVQQGLPVKRGLDGDFVWYPPTMSSRGLFGVDDAVLGGAVLAIIVAIAPLIVGAIVSFVGTVAPGIVQGVTDALAPPKPPPPPPGLFGIDGLDPVVAGVIAVALAAGAFLLWKGHKGHAVA